MDITLVYFVYGLAFFSMGLTMLLESGRSPLVAETRALLPLALFGLVHGCHEWLEMFIDKSDWLVFRDPVRVGWLRIGVLTLSFACLMVFGLRTLHPRRQYHRFDQIRMAGLLVGYIALVLLVGVLLWSTHGDLARHVDAMIRYFLAVPGAVVAGLALNHQSRQARSQGLTRLSVALNVAALGFLIYSLTQLVVSPQDFFPGNWLNTASFSSFTGVPVQVVRAAMAILITIGLMNAVQAAEDVRQRQFLAVQQSRLDALEQVQQELLKREALRQELMRHIVIAQEDERERIARELHDETAQVLTGFTLHLAALRDATPGSSRVREQVDHLLNLSRQMSQGIYRLIHALRPAQLDTLGLVAALQNLVDESREKLGLQVDLQVLGESRRLEPLVETVLFRAAQEALTNVARHAGVQDASVQLQFSLQQVSLCVADQGVGFQLDYVRDVVNGWGLAGIRERAESVGGSFDVRSSPGHGTIVEVTVPLNATSSTIDTNHPQGQAHQGGSL